MQAYTESNDAVIHPASDQVSGRVFYNARRKQKAQMKPGRWEGETSLGGKHPVNVSGGLLSKGHPLGATGVAQIIEIVYQLRGEAGARQVEGAKVGLAHCMGGDKDGYGKSCTINILSD